MEDDFMDVGYTQYIDSESIPNINHIIKYVDNGEFIITSSLCDVQIGDGYDDSGDMFFRLDKLGLQKYKKARETMFQAHDKTRQGIILKYDDDFSGFRYKTPTN